MQLPVLLVLIAARKGHSPVPAVTLRARQGNRCCVGQRGQLEPFPLAPWGLCEDPQHRKSPPNPLLPASGHQTWGIAAVGAAGDRRRVGGWEHPRKGFFAGETFGEVVLRERVWFGLGCITHPHLSLPSLVYEVEPLGLDGLPPCSSLPQTHCSNWSNVWPDGAGDDLCRVF